MSPDEAVVRLDEIAATMARDPERAHCEADGVLLAVAGDDVRAAYQRVVAACPWWAAA